MAAPVLSLLQSSKQTSSLPMAAKALQAAPGPLRAPKTKPSMKAVKALADNIVTDYTFNHPGFAASLASQRPGSGKYGVNPKLWNIVSPYIDKYGLKVIEGYRDPAKASSKSAEHSQHYSGNALDLNYGALDIPTRIALVKQLKEAGITGFGLGTNTLHADLGPYRHWTYDAAGNWISGKPDWFPTGIL